MSKSEKRELKLKKVVESDVDAVETDSDVPDLKARRKKRKGIVIEESQDAKDGKKAKKEKKEKSSKDEKSTAGTTGKQLQSITVEGSSTRATAMSIGLLNLPSGIEWIVPRPKDRPWTLPTGYMCVYESYFKNAHLFFPIPRPIIEFCARKKIAMSQLTTVTLIELMGLILFGVELGILVDAAFLERTEKLIASKSPGTFYTQGGFVLNKPDMINNWQTHFFFVKINEVSVGDAESDVLAEWNRVLGKLIVCRERSSYLLDSWLTELLLVMQV